MAAKRFQNFKNKKLRSGRPGLPPIPLTCGHTQLITATSWTAAAFVGDGDGDGAVWIASDSDVGAAIGGSECGQIRAFRQISVSRVGKKIRNGCCDMFGIGFRMAAKAPIPRGNEVRDGNEGKNADYCNNDHKLN